MIRIFNKSFSYKTNLTKLCFIASLVLCMVFFAPLHSIAQKSNSSLVMKTITGTIKSDKGEPVVGAVVNLEGTVYAAFTDINGKFKLDIPAITTNNARITITMVGMEPLVVQYDGKDTFNLKMNEDSKILDEVVITGYQNIDRRDMVGSYSSLKAEDVLMPSYTSIDQMLQGRVAGLMVTNTSTRVGSAPTITLRGVSTLQGTTSPLWVVDGIIQQDVESIKYNNPLATSKDGNDIAGLIGSAISWLNPNDIETIVVLKDASATAIYGSRASNGVIVVTTKKGTTDKTSVRYSNSTTISFRPTYDDYYIMNSKERINFSKEAYEAGAYYHKVPYAQMYTYEGLMQNYLAGNITEDQFLNQYKYLETVNTDWLDLLTRTAVSHQHNLSLSGKAKAISYNTSVSYKKTEGTEKGNDQDYFSGRIRLGIEASSRVRFDVSLNANVNKTSGFAAGVNPQSYAISTSRAIPAYKENGEYAYYQQVSAYQFNNSASNSGLGYNILNEAKNSYTKVESPQFNATINAQWDILGNDELRYEFVAGYTDYSRSSDSYADEKTFYVADWLRGYDYGTVEDPDDPLYESAQLPHGGVLSKVSSTNRSYNIQNKILYSKTFNKVHRFNAMAAFEIRSNTSKLNEHTIYGFLGGKGNQIAIPTAPDDFEPEKGSSSGWGILNRTYDDYSINEQTNNYVSAFASLAYSYDNKYVFNFNVRNDASNRFGQDVNRQFDPTYSFGFSWRMAEENFMQIVKPYISTLTLKATYGIQGNVLTGYSPELILGFPELNVSYNQYTSKIKKLPNPFLDWERTKTWNWGTNIGLFNNKITLDIDGYLRDSRPLSPYALPAEYGGANIMQNGSKLRNSGIEVTASFTPVNKKDFKLGMSVNFAKNWNKVLDILRNDDTQTITTASYLGGNSAGKGILLEKGYPAKGFWVYDFDKLDPETGYPLFNKMDKSEYSRIIDYLYYAGESESVMSAGININLSYKRLSLNTGLAANLGGKKLLPDPYSNFTYALLPTPDANLSKELVNRWKQPGDEKNTTIPAVYTGGIPVSMKDPSGASASMYTMWARSNDRLVSKSFLRCRQITLSWYAPQAATSKLGLSSLSLSATVSNIFVIASSKYKGMDPETGTSVLPKSVSFGLNVTF